MEIQTIKDNVDSYIQSQNDKSLLRFITCGSVDDGKSTLIGRMLYESKMLFNDQIAALKSDSVKSGTQGEDIDYALLVDGLASEREQGITIDVAYRFFSTEKRKFIVIDTPGHEQYTRNMATGASQAQLAVLLVDARNGLSTQTRRHAFIVKSLGISNFILAINKMDLVDYDQHVFNTIVDDFRLFAQQIDLANFTAVPLSALKGDNVVDHSSNMEWYEGKPLIECLDAAEVGSRSRARPFRMPVQWVNRPNSDFRGFSGRIISGQIQPGDKVVSMPSGQESRVSRIVTMDGDLDCGLPNESVTICLEDEIDVSRGDIICSTNIIPKTKDRFQVQLLWLNENKLRPGQTYIMKIGAQSVNATISRPKYAIDVNTLSQLSQETLALNEIGVCILNTEKPISFEAYKTNREMGGFILIDRLTNATVGMGLIEKSTASVSMELRTQELSIGRELRAEQKKQKPTTIWFTGYKQSGKTFIANALERKLFARGHHSFIIDAETMWNGMSEDLNIQQDDRTENLRRVSHLAKLMNDAGLIVLACFTSPFAVERRISKNTIGEDNFIEVYVDTPLDLAQAQDTQRYYARARAGKIKNVAGIDMLYEIPQNPDIIVGMKTHSIEEAADKILDLLIERAVIAA